MNERAKEDERRVEAISGVNQRGNGFVQITMEQGFLKDKAMVQGTPEEARRIARQIMEAAEAADTDAFIFQFIKNKLNLDEKSAFVILKDFREWRSLSGGVKDRDENDPHWQEVLRKRKEQEQGEWPE